MPAERLSMRKIKEVLRLKFGLGFANRQIARSCSINHSTVADYLYRAKAAGLGQWPLPDSLDEAESGKAVVSHGRRRGRSSRGQRRIGPPSMKISTATSMSRCNWFGRSTSSPIPMVTSTAGSVGCISSGPSKLDLVLRQEHRAGEKLFVDYAGDTVPIVDSKTGTIQKASIFVAVLGASNYTYAEATVEPGTGFLDPCARAGSGVSGRRTGPAGSRQLQNSGPPSLPV